MTSNLPTTNPVSSPVSRGPRSDLNEVVPWFELVPRDGFTASAERVADVLWRLASERGPAVEFVHRRDENGIRFFVRGPLGRRSVGQGVVSSGLPGLAMYGVDYVEPVVDGEVFELSLASEDVALLPMEWGTGLDPLTGALQVLDSCDGAVVEIVTRVRRASSAAARRMRSQARRVGSPGGGSPWFVKAVELVAAEFTAGKAGPARGGASGGRSGTGAGVARKVAAADVSAAAGKVAGGVRLLEVACFVRIVSSDRRRDAARVAGWVADALPRGANYWKVSRALGQGHRFDNGKMAGRRQVVMAEEVAMLARPPMANCHVAGVEKLRGLVGRPDPRLDEWTLETTRDVIPLGFDPSSPVPRVIGMKASGARFGYWAGASGFGKTTTAEAMAFARVLGGTGATVIDPHADMIARLLPYLAKNVDPSRVMLLDAEARDVVPFNPLNMVAAREAAEVRARADVAEFGGSFESRYRHALTDAINRKIGLVVGWMHFLMATSAADYPRATEIAAHAAQAIATLNVLLPADAQLGIFDIPRFFLDHEWLEAMRQVLPRDLARYWEQEFSVAAYAPVVRPLNELRVASVRAMLSASESVFDAREAMDAGRVVLWRTYVSGDVDVTTQVSALAFRDAVHGIMGRGQVARADRVPHEIFVDEVQRMAGAHSGRVTMQRVIQEALEQGGKFGLKMWLMSQQPSEVAEPVLRALITNARTLGSFNVGAESMLGKLGEAFDEVPKRTFAKLPLHHAVVKAHIDGVGKSEAFQVEGLILERMFPGMAATDDEVREYRRTLNRQWGARPVGDIQAEFDERRDLTMDRVQHVPESLLRLIGGMPSTVDGGVPVDRLFPDA